MNHPSRTNIYIKNPLCPLWALWQPKKMKKEPNLRRFRISTFGFPPGRTPILRNKPNPTRPTAKKCETNPIPANTPNLRNKKCETNPIYRPPRPSRRVSHPHVEANRRSACGGLHETNPIYSPRSHPSVLVEAQSGVYQSLPRPVGGAPGW